MKTIISETVKAKVTADDIFFYISIGGTDEADDLKITFDSKPNILQFHTGCSRVAKDIAKQFDQRYSIFAYTKIVKLKGHSMGAGIAELVAFYLEKMGWNISTVRLYGGYGISIGTYYHKYQIYRYRCGNDIVPLLFPKYTNKPFIKVDRQHNKPWPIRFVYDHNDYDREF